MAPIFGATATPKETTGFKFRGISDDHFSFDFQTKMTHSTLLVRLDSIDSRMSPRNAKLWNDAGVN